LGFICLFLFTGSSQLKSAICDLGVCLPCKTFRDGNAATKEITNVTNNSTTNNITNVTNTGGSTGGATGSTGLTKEITQADFTPCYEITSPGVYILASPINLQLATADTCTCGLTISSSDVILDLRGFTIYYGDEGTSSAKNGISGICISPGYSNVTIKNGAVRRFTDYGIKGHSSSSANIKQVLIDGVTVQNNNVGISLVGTSAYPVTLANITGSNVSCNSKTGLELTYVNTGKIRSVTSSENTNSGSDLYGTAFSGDNRIVHGVKVEDSNNLDLSSIDAERNTTSTASLNSYGIRIIDSNYISLTSSNSNYNTAGSGADSYGVSLETSNNSIVDSVVVEANTYGISTLSTDANKTDNATNLFIRNTAIKNSTNYNVALHTGAALRIVSGDSGGTATLNSAEGYDNVSVN